MPDADDVASTTEGNARDSNSAVLRRLNQEITLRAPRASNSLLQGAFRSVFLVPQAYEYSEPDVFELDQSPDQIMWRRLDAFRLKKLTLAIVNGDVPTARYQVYMEYDFIVVIDVSQSMMNHWWGVYGGRLSPEVQSSFPPGDQIAGDATKLFVAKYALAAFVRAAITRKFRCIVVLAGAGQVSLCQVPQNAGAVQYVLSRMDDHFRRMALKAAPEKPILSEALSMVLRRSQRCVVLCISDFADTRVHINEHQPRVAFPSLTEPFAEIATAHRLLVFQVNDLEEVFPGPGVAMTVGSRESSCLNGEIVSGNPARHILPEELRRFGEIGQRWYESAASAFMASGIHFSRVLAGHDHQALEKRICELGIAGEGGF